MNRIFITGTNRGIGLALVRAYLRQTDARIFAGCRQPDKAHQLHQLSQEFQGRLEIIQIEVSDRDSIYAASDAVANQTDGVDILINNAGINPSGGKQRLETITSETMTTVLHINAFAPLIITQAFLDLLKQGQETKIINISSEMGSIEHRDYGGYYAYCTSKAALNMISRAMAVDLGKHKMIVCALDPGWVKTDMGGDSATLTPETSAMGILQVISGLTSQDNGSYLRWNGDTLPW